MEEKKLSDRNQFIQDSLQNIREVNIPLEKDEQEEPESNKEGFESTNNGQKPIEPAPTFISDYLVSSQNSDQMDGLIDEIQTLVEHHGASATTNKNGISSPLGLKGKYKKLIVLSGKLTNTPTSLDQSAISTEYLYSIKIYDIESSKLLNSRNDRIVSVGFSESENAEKIKKQVLPQIKSLL